MREHWTNKHGTLVDKVQFRTLADCLAFMEKNKINKDIYHPYICSECGMWHIGHSQWEKKKSRKR